MVILKSILFLTRLGALTWQYGDEEDDAEGAPQCEPHLGGTAGRHRGIFPRTYVFSRIPAGIEESSAPLSHYQVVSTTP